jgi:hypothetical protein
MPFSAVPKYTALHPKGSNHNNTDCTSHTDLQCISLYFTKFAQCIKDLKKNFMITIKLYFM